MDDFHAVRIGDSERETEIERESKRMKERERGTREIVESVAHTV
jgi:hypothetical protein